MGCHIFNVRPEEIMQLLQTHSAALLGISEFVSKQAFVLG